MYLRAIRRNEEICYFEIKDNRLCSHVTKYVVCDRHRYFAGFALGVICVYFQNSIFDMFAISFTLEKMFFSFLDITIS